MNQQQSRGKFLQRRECLLPTWRGWLVLLTAMGVLLLLGLHGIYPFLAVNDRVDGDAIVVEGWLPDYALKQAATEFTRGHYQRILVTGGPLESGAPLSEYHSFAELGAATLIRFGLASNTVQAVPAPPVRVDRTYASAVALKNWLDKQSSTETTLTVVTLGAHARRTRLLFEKAFGNKYRIGIIALENQDYDPTRWWTSSAGVRTVLDETIAYFYARVF